MIVPYTGRFAPSPTGPLHLGSLVAALASWLDARAAGGRWLLRIEDVDGPRCVPGAADQMQRQLAACGLEWDGEVLYQSQRGDAYAAALDQLKRADRAYPCACTRSQLVAAPKNAEGETLYPGTCRAGLPPGATPRAWRARVDDVSACFHDRVHGSLCQKLASEVGDFIVKRADGLFAYQLAVVVDDAFQGITDVVRGADLLWNTPRQVHLQNLLGLPTPRYAHVPLVVNAAGQKLSKQSLAPALPEAGCGAALVEALAVLGHTPQVDAPGTSPAELLGWALAHWDISRVPLRPVLAKPAQAADNLPLAPSP